ncbi:MAG: hypothetical protein ACLPJH_13915 [Myxococcaceae bacterium]
MSVSRPLTLLCGIAFATGCAHAGAGTEADEQAAVAEGIRAAIRLYLPATEPLAGTVCVEVASPSAFEQGVVGALADKGMLALAMADCGRAGKEAVLLVRVLSYDWVDWLTHGKLTMHGTVETPPDEPSKFRLSWWRAQFRADLVFYEGQWVASADDLGRM